MLVTNFYKQSWLLLLLILGACGSDRPEASAENHEADSLLKAPALEPVPAYTAAEKDSLLRIEAHQLAQEFIIIDGHVDLPYRLQKRDDDISGASSRGDFDYVRAKAGGLDAPFMSIYIPARLESSLLARKKADQLINMVEALAKDHPDKFALALSPEDIRQNTARGLISLPMGMENGAPLLGELQALDYFYKRGIRYITLAHSKSNHISDSSYDPKRRWGGLSPFGRTVVERMNQLGIMVDVSHVSDSAFFQALRLSRAPVIASHSSARYFTPGFERNMSDEMIKALALKEGLIMINFGSAFISDKSRRLWNQARGVAQQWGEAQGLSASDPAVERYREAYFQQEGGLSTVAEVAAHIDHVVKLAGIDHVGLGSDFEGVGDTLPQGLKDVSQYPNLIYELLKLGYSREDVQKVLSGNLLRVWEKVAQVGGASAVES